MNRTILILIQRFYRTWQQKAITNTVKNLLILISNTKNINLKYENETYIGIF